jgi:hypothetical protein
MVTGNHETAEIGSYDVVSLQLTWGEKPDQRQEG